jgi:hypothetical protein
VSLCELLFIVVSVYSVKVESYIIAIVIDAQRKSNRRCAQRKGARAMSEQNTTEPSKADGAASALIAGLGDGGSDDKKKFIIGNCLRGCFEGEFTSIETAWRVLSARFLLSYPSADGRNVLMWVREQNVYGITSNVLCKQGVTSTAPVSDSEVAECRKSLHIG